MFDWLKRLLSDPPAASLPGDIANPLEVPEFLPSKDDRIEDARRLLEEAVDILGDCGLSYFEIKDTVCDVVDGYDDWLNEEDDDGDDDDSWFPGKEYNDDEHDISCECPECSDADDDYI